MAAGLLQKGAAPGAVIAFITAKTLLSLTRTFTYELPLLGWRLTLARVLPALALPPLLGMVGQSIFNASQPEPVADSDPLEGALLSISGRDGRAVHRELAVFAGAVFVDQHARVRVLDQVRPQAHVLLPRRLVATVRGVAGAAHVEAHDAQRVPEPFITEQVVLLVRLEAVGGHDARGS